jgi:hypothetical protein
VALPKSQLILNRFPVDPDRLKIVILSSPKTGNIWLRYLLHSAYGIQMVDLPQEWSSGCADNLPSRFVTHEHFFPSESLVRWLVESRAVVLTTIRHPGDTFSSYFHYVKWNDNASAAMLRQDGDRPGKNALKFITHWFPQLYELSLTWAKLGSHVVRYEDLLVDPLSQLREVTSKIVPLDEERLRAAVFLCKPAQLTRVLDQRHLRSCSARRWIQELPSEIVDAMASLQPYTSACKMYKYDWSRSALELPRYDYDKIDPFRGHDRFDNGELIGPWLAKIYLHEVPNASARWPDPWITEGESFWNWLRAPSALASLNPDLPAGTLTNIMVMLQNMRPDLELAYGDPLGKDRMSLVMWFLGQARMEFQIPWGLIEPVLNSFCDYLNSMSDATFPPASTTRRPNGKEIKSTHATSRVQVFAPRYGTYTENHSNTAEIPIGAWHRVRVDLPWSLGDRSGGLRLDPGDEVAIIDIAGILLQSKLTGKVLWRARGPAELSNLTVGGTAIALPDERLFRIFSFGEDPQVIIPRLSGSEFAVPLRLEAWVHFERSVQAIGRAMAAFYSYHSKAQQELQEEIKSKQDKIEQERFVLEAKLRQVQEEIKSKQDKIAALTSDSEAMRKELSSLRPKLESIQRQAWDYKAYRADLTTRFKDRDRRIQEIERSLAWKITKPFWKLERHFKRTPEQIAAAGQLVFALDGPGTWNASYDVFTLKGWCYSSRGPQIVGVRAKVGRKSYFARYGIEREPVAQTAPNHPPALYSGFSVDVPVPEGTSSIRLEGIAQGSRWECFLEHPVPPRTDQPQIPARGDGPVQSTGAFALTAISMVFETSSSFFA